MKIILSRKGFDSANGYYPSPIIDGRPLSLPIPDQQDKIKYSNLIFNNKSYLQIMAELGMRNYNSQSTCHFDPDLVFNALPDRISNHNWRGTLGQIKQAQKHLENQGVGVGDIFLFFGWFKEAEYVNNKLSYKKNSKYPNGFNLIYGYLEIGEIIKTATQDTISILKSYPWLENHPHFSREGVRKLDSNTIYIGAEKFALRQNQAGFGILPFSEKLILTKAGESRSRWDLDRLKRLQELPITYHKPESWQKNYFKSASIGQEFVIEKDKQAEKWAKELIKN